MSAVMTLRAPEIMKKGVYVHSSGSGAKLLTSDSGRYSTTQKGLGITAF